MFTFAELDFLLSSHPAWSEQRDALQLPGGESEAVQFAGMASLLARGLARVDGADVVVSDEVAALAAMVRSCTGQVTLAAVTGENEFSTSTFAFSADRQIRMLNSTVAPGVIELHPLRSDADLVGMLVDISVSAIREQGGVIAIGHNGLLLQIQHEGASWSWRSRPDEPLTPSTETEVCEQIAKMFGPALMQPVS